MIHLSSYHSNGLPTVVWPNKVNLIGEKVYKPKIHFCEHCNKPILIYGRLIPCKHVFCFSCATLCLTQQHQQPHPNKTNSNKSPNHHNHNHNHHHHHPYIRSDSNQSFSSRTENNNGGAAIMCIDESTSNTTPTTMQQDLSTDSPGLAIGANCGQSSLHNNHVGKGCHRCSGKTLRVERNTLNSIFVCQIESCRRTYLSARDLQAHVNHRHSKNKTNNNSGTTSASLAAISSSPYISTSSLLHLNSSNNPSSGSGNHRQSSTNRPSCNNNNSPNYSQHRHDKDHHTRPRDRDRDRYRDRDREGSGGGGGPSGYQARDREREPRDTKEYHRQSIQRAAQWAEASAQMMEKGLTR